MMIRYLSLLLCFFSIGCAKGQTPAGPDSLINLLRTLPEDVDKIDVYDKVCWHYIDKSPDLLLATTYADSMKILATALNNQKGVFQAAYSHGVISHHQGNYAQALSYLDAYIGYCKAVGDSSLLAKGLYHSAIVHIHKGNYERSLALFYRILSIEEAGNNPKKIATILNAIGAVYKNAGKFREAITAYQQAAEIFKRSNLLPDYGMCLQNLGNVYVSLQRYDSAKQAYEAALAIFRDSGNKSFIATALGNLGNLHESTGQYEKAARYHREALAIWRQDTRKRPLANSLNNLGKTFLELKRYAAAEQYLNEALALALEIKSDPLLLEVYSSFNAMYVAKQDFKRAYHYYTLANQARDSIFNDNNVRQMNQLQAEYEAARKDKQIALLARDQEVQKTETQRQAMVSKALGGGLVLTLLITALLYFIFRQRQVLARKNDEVKEADFKRKVSELELRALRAQINPHFLFNCMNAINLMILKDEGERASLYLGKFSKMVRLILENADTAVSLQDEMALLESYIQLEALRFPGTFTYRISVEDSIEIKRTHIPSMVLQPVVENAIWHGIVHKGNSMGGLIVIDVSRREDQLYCTVEDNGVGRDQARALRDRSLLQNKSMGIKITEDRLRLLNRTRADRCIEITDLKDPLNQPAGTRVTLQIPIAEQYD
jgi:tetratricopeptide (TPR) repeat protein